MVMMTQPGLHTREGLLNRVVVRRARRQVLHCVASILDQIVNILSDMDKDVIRYNHHQSRAVFLGDGRMKVVFDPVSEFLSIKKYPS